MTLNAIDLFAGAGGWDLACKELAFDPLGIELDDAACATRKAAGMQTWQADVADLDPDLTHHLEFGPFPVGDLDLLIASPPCPTFSSAGNGGGRHLTEIVVRCLHEFAAGNDTRAERRADALEILRPIYWEAEQRKAEKNKRLPDAAMAAARARRDADMSLLVVEPLRWTLALEPRFIALEQVPEVVGLWSEMAQILEALGYKTWTGIMEAERYGVPQTRERAILIADREAPVHPPRPTHQRYVKGEPQRHEMTLEGEVKPWVSMAEALGWLPGTLTGNNSIAGGELAQRETEEPALTVGSRADLWKLRKKLGHLASLSGRDRGGEGTRVFTNCNTRSSEGPERRRPNGVEFDAGERPAPTVDQTVARWSSERPAPTIVTTRRSKDGIIVGRQLPDGEGENVGGHNWPSQARDSGPGAERGPRSSDEPSYTLRANGSGSHPAGVKWVEEGSSTTVNGDPRISRPGRHDPEESRSQQKDAVRVTLEEALILQGFPPDYPVQGSTSQRFLQIGNAVPPLLAKAILSELLKSVLQSGGRTLMDFFERNAKEKAFTSRQSWMRTNG